MNEIDKEFYKDIKRSGDYILDTLNIALKYISQVEENCNAGSDCYETRKIKNAILLRKKELTARDREEIST